MTDERPPQKKRNWVLIVFAAIGLFFVLTIGGCFVAIAMFRQNMTITEMNPDSAESEFAKVRAKFAGQKPLIEMVDRRPRFDDSRPRPESPAPVTTMRVMAWDDDEEQLVTFALPFWLLRLKPGPIQLSAYSAGWDDRGFSFRVEDLEKYGPGLLLDLSEEREGRVIIWTE
jgi:hypothetical protein